MEIRKINTEDKKDLKSFIKFPFSLYKDCPQWVPSLHSEMISIMNKKKHPFYAHSEADFFVVESEKEVLGRIAVLNNRNYCKFQNKETSFFYLFESINDKEVSTKLFDKVAEWSRQRKLDSIIGPKGFLRTSGMGLLVEGFEHLPALSIPYNLLYYETLLLDWGFQKEIDQFSGYMTTDQQLPARLYEIADKVKQKGNYWIKTFKNLQEIKDIIPLVKTVQDIAFLDNPNYFPSTDEEFKLIAQSMIQISEPGMIKLIMKGDEVAGFVISYPDISKAIQRTRGYLFPFGWIHLLLEKKRTRVVNFNGVGILPKYQGLGANALLYTELEKTIRQRQFMHAEFVQVNENNFKSKSDWETLGVHMNKIHRTYKYSF